MSHKVDIDHLAEVAFNAYVKGRADRLVEEGGHEYEQATFDKLPEPSKEWWREVAWAITTEVVEIKSKTGWKV